MGGDTPNHCQPWSWPALVIMGNDRICVHHERPQICCFGDSSFLLLGDGLRSAWNQGLRYAFWMLRYCWLMLKLCMSYNWLVYKSTWWVMLYQLDSLQDSAAVDRKHPLIFAKCQYPWIKKSIYYRVSRLPLLYGAEYLLLQFTEEPNWQSATHDGDTVHVTIKPYWSIALVVI